MKTIKSVLISLAFSLFFINTAVAYNYVPVLKVVDKKVYVSLKDVSEETSVRLLDDKGLTVMEESVNASKRFNTVINFESLPIGAYTLIIKSSTEETVHPIMITKDMLVLEENKLNATHPVVFTKNRKNLNLTFMNPENTAVKVYIMDRMGKVHYRETMEDQKMITKDFNLKHFPTGEYTVIVEKGDKVYTKSVNVN